MVKAARRLKVFQAQLGFYDSVVAAPSQTAALKAWGVRQNLFAEGAARVTTETEAVKAALAHPETPLQRAVGSSGAFKVEAADPPKLATSPKTGATQRTSKPAPSRTELDTAEAALQTLDKRRAKEEADFLLRQETLDRQKAEAEARSSAARKAAEETVAAARKVYRRAGGA